MTKQVCTCLIALSTIIIVLLCTFALLHHRNNNTIHSNAPYLDTIGLDTETSSFDMNITYSKNDTSTRMYSNITTKNFDKLMLNNNTHHIDFVVDVFETSSTSSSIEFIYSSADCSSDFVVSQAMSFPHKDLVSTNYEFELEMVIATYDGRDQDGNLNITKKETKTITKKQYFDASYNVINIELIYKEN